MKRHEQQQTYLASERFSRSHLVDVGWGFAVAWGLAVVFTDTFSQGSTSNLGLFWLASMVGTPAALLAFFFVKRPLREQRIEQLQLLALAGMVVGTAVLALSLWAEPALASGMQLVGGLVSSFGAAVFAVLWGAHYTMLDLRRIERSAAFALILAFACYAAVLVLPDLVAMVFVVCLPFLSVLCLKAAQRQDAAAESAEGARRGTGQAEEATGRAELAGQAEPGRCDAPGSAAAAALPFDVKGFVRTGLGIVGSTTTISLFWSMVNSGTIPLARGLFEGSVLSGTVVAVLLMVYMTRFSRSLNLGTLYRWVLPIIAFAFALLFAPSDKCTLAACLLVFACSSLLNLLTFVYFAELAKRTGALPHRVFGLGRFFLEAGFLIGILLAPAASDVAAGAGSYQGVLAFVLAGLVALMMVSIGTQDKLAFALDGRLEGGRTSLEDVLGEKCRAVADRHGLTNREREILPYLAQGYSLPYIRNELYIAQSTIDTHVRHIYQKLGIHSREELITKVRDA